MLPYASRVMIRVPRVRVYFARSLVSRPNERLQNMTMIYYLLCFLIEFLVPVPLTSWNIWRKSQRNNWVSRRHSTGIEKLDLERTNKGKRSPKPKQMSDRWFRCQLPFSSLIKRSLPCSPCTRLTYVQNARSTAINVTNCPLKSKRKRPGASCSKHG